MRKNVLAEVLIPIVILWSAFVAYLSYSALRFHRSPYPISDWPFVYPARWIYEIAHHVLRIPNPPNLLGLSAIMWISIIAQSVLWLIPLWYLADWLALQWDGWRVKAGERRAARLSKYLNR